MINPGPGAVVVPLNTVEPERVRWLWDGHIALGKITILDGLPDMGKSTIAVDLAARVTLGAPMPDGTEARCGPSDVVLLSAEDGLADTVVPRLLAAGGDPNRVHAITAVRISERGRLIPAWPELERDVHALAEVVADTEAKLVIVDVLMAYLGADVNSYRDQDMRRVLGPLAKMAESLDVAVLLLRHPTKAGSPNAVLVGGGSIGIIGAARVGLLAGFDPDDDQEDLNLRRRLLAVAKCNVAPKAATLAYRLDPHPQLGCARIRWEGSTGHRADDLVAAHDDRHERADKRLFLLDLLADGPVRVLDVERKAFEAGGWSLKALRPTLRALGGRPMQTGFGDTKEWWWTLGLPSDAP